MITAPHRSDSGPSRLYERFAIPPLIAYFETINTSCPEKSPAHTFPVMFLLRGKRPKRPGRCC